MPMEGETGQLAPHYPRAGLGKGLPMHPCPCRLPWGWMGQWGCAPLNPWNPQGQGCSPKGTWEQPLAQPWANTHCLLPVPQGNDVLEDEDASPTQEDGKRPWVVVIPLLSAHCHRESGVPCCPQLP